jgi:aryl-alcohol dehydrogenase-like predicted oxidoreductase
MEYRELGASGLLVSPICLGTMTFGNPVTEADAVALVHAAIDQGVNFIDTANVYEGYDRVLGSSGGVAESIVGKALRDRRDKVVLTTKVCAPIGPGPQDRGLSASHILREVDRSLQRLGTDYIDLYVIHWPDEHVPRETTLAAIEQTVRQGKVRCFGVSNHFAEELCELLWLSDKRHWPRVVSSQIPYSMLLRHYHRDLEFCQRHNIGVTPYQPLQGGVLTGKYKRGQQPAAGTRGADMPSWLPDLDDALFDKLEQLEQLANEIGVPVSQYVLAWTLAQPAMSSLVVGVTRQQHLEDALAAASVQIPDEHMAKVDQIFPPPWIRWDPIRS